jgi:hypothetical protein
VKLAARKSVSGRTLSPLEGGSRITSAPARWQVAPCGQASTRVKCRPLVLSVRLISNRLALLR